MALFNEACQAFEKLMGGQNAPIGTYWNPRTMCYYQLAADGVLPAAGAWFAVTTSGTSTATQITTAVNAGMGTSYTNASFHAESGTDLLTYPGATGIVDG